MKKLNEFKHIIFLIVIAIIMYMMLLDWQKDYDKKCYNAGGEPKMVVKSKKCKLPDGTFIKIDSKW